MTRFLLLVTVFFVTIADAGEPGPDLQVEALWRALSHGPGEGADTAELVELFHADARVLGSAYRDDGPVFSSMHAGEFIESVGEGREEAFHECEVARRVVINDRFASIVSVVESRQQKNAVEPDFTGINSIDLYRGKSGWKVVSLYYHVPEDGRLPAPGGFRMLRAGSCPATS